MEDNVMLLDFITPLRIRLLVSSGNDLKVLMQSLLESQRDI